MLPLLLDEETTLLLVKLVVRRAELVGSTMASAALSVKLMAAPQTASVERAKKFLRLWAVSSLSLRVEDEVWRVAVDVVWEVSSFR